MKIFTDDLPIVAISSGLKNAAIGVIRTSGNKIIEIVSKIFKSHKNIDITKSKGYKVYFGWIHQNNELIDEVIIIVYRSPKSYTGEDMVEINCHGNLILMQKIVDLLIQNGCRLARPGEFTLRAVLNKKIDLTKAIAIRDIIESSSKQMLELSIQNLKGKLSNKIKQIREKLLYWLGWIEALFDFPEEDIPIINLQNLKIDLETIIKDIEIIISNYQISQMYREGIDTVIVGKPNVGKSTLFNYLYGQERVIISDIPGTTRDVITEYININGVILKLYDTAGFRKTKDIIENIGIQKAKEIISKSKLILWVLEYGQIDENDLESISQINQNQKILIIINKIDKENQKNKIIEFENKVKSIFQQNYPTVKTEIISCSLKQNINLENLHKKIATIIGLIDQEEIIMIDNFQYETLKNILTFLKNTLKDFHLGEEIISVNLREALNKITELTGENLTDIVIDNILTRFCIGK